MIERAARLLLFLLPVAASVGPMIRIGPLALARVVVAGLVALAVLLVWRRGELPRVAVWLLLFLGAWMAWGIFRVHGEEGQRELLSVAVGLLTLVATVSVAGRDTTSQRSDPMSWLRTSTRGWLLGWFAVSLPALWEISTGRHLWNYREDSAPWIRLVATDAASYMVNPNLFAMFLAAAMGMLMVGWVVDSPRVRWLYAMAVVATPVIAWFTGSRLVILVLPLYLAGFLIQFRWARWLAAAGAGLVMLAVVYVIPGVMAQPWGAPEPTGGSVAMREALYRNGWYMMWDTLGFGVGPGQFESQVLSGQAPYDTLGGPPNPHSGLFETGSQYGVVILVMGLALFGAALVLSWPALERRWTDPTWRRLRWLLLMLTLTCLPLSFANSAWLDSSVAFVQMGGMALMAHVLLEARIQPLPTWSGRGTAATLPTSRRLLRATLARTGRATTQ
ncbi:O-antigen ligase family protein [Aestuariimicrobium ganziense]|uniref:O-antigen ligase family protein n=1 Tax=Aestuariimicrobium ganziense TaxID=2773677 RepID=UPI0019418513|nr:O-antigen ligase family protein [Aestuariimicrobium ganziense]